MNAYDALPCAVLVTDAEGKVQQMNADLLQLLGGSIADWQGQRLDALLPPASRIFMHTHLWPMLLRDGKLAEVYLQIQGVAGERIPVLINCRQEAQTYVWILFVSKERSRFESELVLARQQAEIASAAKSTFLANMSHEIRTPMNAVLGLLQVLQQAGLDERGRGHAIRAEQAARVLLRMLDDVLDLSDAESGRLTLVSEDFELQPLLAELVLMLASGDGWATVELLIEVAPDVPARLFGDRHRLQQVLLNLCANALKFTHQGQVAVAITYSGTRVMFSVQDTGIGIAAEQLVMIFEAFTQVDASASRQFGGSGLGLTICKRLVALMGGELAVESVSGTGSRFFFDLALRDAHHLPVLASAMPISLAPLSCLIADSHPDARRILRDLVLARGDQVAEVSSTPALLAACERQRYDVVLVDQRLLDGHERALGQLHARWAVAPQTVVCRRHAAVRKADGVNGLGLQVAATLDKPILACHLHNAFVALAGAISEAVAAAPGGVRQQLAGLRVLVVDDNSLNQEVARDLLSAVGASVEVAGDGYIALSMLADRDAFDVVLMDIQMPGIDGYETTRAIRRQERWRHMPIIAVTANVLPSDRMAALTAGMNDHVGKPLDLALLVGVIRHHLLHEKRPVDVTGSRLN